MQAEKIENSSGSRAVALLSWVLGISSVLMVAAMLWGLNRGFDTTDEGSYLLGYAGRLWMRHKVVMIPFGDHFTPGLIFFRALHLAIALGSALVLAWGALVFLRDQVKLTVSRALRCVVVSACVMGSMMGYVVGPYAAHYNHFGAAGLSVVSGMGLWLMARPREAFSWSCMGVVAMTGVLLGYLYDLRFPSSICGVVAFAVVLMLFLTGTPVWKRGVLLVMLILLYIMSFLFFAWCATGHGAGASVERMVSTGSGAEGTAYAMGPLLRWSIEQIVMVPLMLGKAFALTVLSVALWVVGAWWCRDRKPLLRRGVDCFFGGLSVATFLFQLYRWKLYRTGLDATPQIVGGAYVLIVMLLVVVAIVHCVIASGRLPSLGTCFNPWVGAIGLLFVMPYAGVMGTGNPIYYNILYHLQHWFCLVLLATAGLWAWRHTRLPLAFLAVMGVAVAQAQFWSGAVGAPYRFDGSLMDQTTLVQGIPRLAGVRLSPRMAKGMAELKALVEPYRDESGELLILGFYDMVGIVYALDARSPGYMWYHASLAKHEKETQQGILRAAKDELRRAVVLVNDELPESLLSTLREQGCDFPGGYVRIGEVDFPDIIRRGRAARPFEVYVPRVMAEDSKQDAAGARVE